MQVSLKRVCREARIHQFIKENLDWVAVTLEILSVLSLNERCSYCVY